jgi:purine-binding chemotaxis protein CheW
MLLGEPTVKPERLVAIRVNDRTIALAVTAVLGLESITSAGLPPLLREAAGEIIAAITVLDAEILLVLNAARIVPDGLLEDLAAREPVL